MRAVDAIKIVARQVLADLAEYAAEQWENYPEIGEHDWDAVVTEVVRLAPLDATSAGFVEAYSLLESRAANKS
jgi:hypothetical protein